MDSKSVNWSSLRLDTVTLRDRLSARLEEMIVESKIAGGTRLPSERALATDLGVSRTSLRDALRQLELKGLIDRRPGRGTVVVDSQGRQLSADLLAKLSVEDRTLREVMDLRATIEPPIASRAASRATAQNLRRLHEIQMAMESTERPEQRTTELDAAFHGEIARATHNAVLVRLVETAADWFQPSRHLALQSRQRFQATIAAHARILEAIVAHDEVAAELEMRDHIKTVNSFVRKSLD